MENEEKRMTESENTAATRGEPKQLTKFDIWEKKLLDLSRRNQLIDFKRRGKGLQVYSYDMQGLYDALESRKKTYLLTEAEYRAAEKDPLELPYIDADGLTSLRIHFENGTLPLVKRCYDVPESLKYFFRERKKAFEETGSNVFYLALGFVAWKDAEREGAECYSPLILVPVDLKRNSRDSYSLCGRDEIPFLNISAFQFFRQEFKLNFDDLLASPLFEDSGEVKVEDIFRTVEERLSKLEGTRVVRAAALNIFNFSKAVMWQDIRYRRDMLAQNRVIRAILAGNYVLGPSEQTDGAFDDDTTLPGDLAIPLSADSSQLDAIRDCAAGKSFVLQGPPGTGKSQTITNMIVNAIYHGKTVLFVAEKMAALEVVQKRLKKLSLDVFALETHSVKSDKSAIMEQFERRIALGRTVAETEKYDRMSGELFEKRQELNRVIARLHRENGYFLSFYDAFVRYLDIGSAVPAVPFSADYVQKRNEETFAKGREAAENYQTMLWENGGYEKHPFLLYRDANYVPGTTKAAILAALPAFQQDIDTFLAAYGAFAEANGLAADTDKNGADALLSLLSHPALSATLPALCGTSLGDSREFRELLDTCGAYSALLQELRRTYTDGIFALDAEAAETAYTRAQAAFFLSKAVKTNRLCKEVRAFAKNPKEVRKEALPALYEKLQRRKTLEAGMQKNWGRFAAMLGPFPQDPLSFDFDDLRCRAENTVTLCAQYGTVPGTDLLRQICEKTENFTLQQREPLLAAYQRWQQTEARFEKELSFDFTLCAQFGMGYADLSAKARAMQENTDSLSNWCALLHAREVCVACGLAPVLEYAEKTPLSELAGLGDVYAKSVYDRILSEAIVDTDGRSFNSVELGRRMESYRSLIDTFSVQIIKETAARITADTPLINEDSPASSEQGILNRAIRSRCRGKSVRQLFGEIQHVLPRLFPVFLMSPLSCAQFLSPDMPKFDIVIFDEASQMPTAEAVGAISRGNSLIVVGDSKQMPPTSFFQTQNAEEDDVSDLDDLESILDDCDAIGLPSNALLWHYRSRHESLIRFSNVRFYRNALTTFPSPNDMQSKVSFRNVGGVYEMKKATNAGEADAIVEEIRRRLSDPELRKSSIGVVTFSAVQQELVEDKLTEMFAENRELEKINLDSSEPLIVKNLENIQGDERDVILFSICYGPDSDGKMYYRFGPINNPGGEKRLNVAVSRARSEMIVFASFEPERLAAMKSDALGAQSLYAFLRYAKYGADTLEVDKEDVKNIKPGIEAQMAGRLSCLGYTVHTDVGKSGFRVDLAVVDPDNPAEYLLGIVLDSYSYEAARTSRDRNVVQPSVLEGLGWHLMRVWSFDYYDNPDKVIHEIAAQIEQVRAHRGEPAAEKPAVNLHVSFESRATERRSYAVPYVAHGKVYDFSGYTTEYQYNRAAVPLVQEIVNTEAPISKDLLYSRFVRAADVSRITAKQRNAVDSAVRVLGLRESRNFAGTVTFYWKKDQNMLADTYRVSEEKLREAADVPKEEVFAAVREVLENHGALPVGDLRSCVADCFGFRQLRGQAAETIDDAIAYYRQTGALVYHPDDSRIYLKA